MSTISNRFYVTALEDGTTLHGNLAATKSLSQSYNVATGACSPDWRNKESTRPTIYLTLLNGSDYVPPTSYAWYYNGTQIALNDPRFVQGTYSFQGLNMPALTIIDNLANSENVDIDTITLKGTYNIGGSTAALDFSATCQVRISSMTKGGGIGVINFVDGISDITAKGQTITAYGILYDDSGDEVSGVSTKWFLNDDVSGTNGTTIDGYANAYQVYENDKQAEAAGATGRYVVDHALVRCEFWTGTGASAQLKYTAYAGIDDMQDPEFMYIQYAGNNANNASLRKGEAATFKIWVGTRSSSELLRVDPSDQTSNPLFAYLKIMLLNAEGAPIIHTDDGIINSDTPSHPSNIPKSDSAGWSNISYSQDDKKFQIALSYGTVTGFGKNVTGILSASTQPFT